jgi:N-methylhydantoinase A
MPRYERGALLPGESIAGPALIEDDWSTIVVYPGQRASVDPPGNVILEDAR